jgi:hypothetical protein
VFQEEKEGMGLEKATKRKGPSHLVDLEGEAPTIGELSPEKALKRLAERIDQM